MTDLPTIPDLSEGDRLLVLWGKVNAILAVVGEPEAHRGEILDVRTVDALTGAAFIAQERQTAAELRAEAAEAREGGY